jgi:hypothetical protein
MYALATKTINNKNYLQDWPRNLGNNSSMFGCSYLFRLRESGFANQGC